jgi:hypothetical protein
MRKFSIHSVLGLTLTLGLLASASVAHGSEGAGSSGGGHGLTEAGKLKLREFVEGVTCRWETGPKFFGTYSSPDSEVGGPTVLLNQPLGYLFYFLLGDGEALSAYYDEAAKLNVCLSQKPLRELPEEVKEAIAAYAFTDIDQKVQSPTQIAIRLGDDLYIDEAAFAKLDRVNQDYLKFHEILHGFIPMDVSARMTKLRDFVAGLREIDLAFPRNSQGSYAYDLTADFRAVVQKQQALYEALKTNNDVDFDFTGGPLSREMSQLKRHLTLGDVTSHAYTMRRYSIDPNQKGRSGKSLFHELVFQLSGCLTTDPRPMCVHAAKFVALYLKLGADPDLAYSTGEWEPMPVWQYWLFSMNRAGRDNRLDWAELAMAKKVLNAGGLTTAIRQELDTTLLRVVRDNYLALSAHRLIRWGADVNARDAEGRSALLVAVEQKGHGNNLFASYPATYLIGVLLLNGADTSVKNAEGKTALEIMKGFGGPLRPLYDNTEMYELGVKALEAGQAGLAGLRPEFERLGMPLPQEKN